MCSEPYKVSILIPIYGVEKYIEQCARSAFSQTYRNIEYIFVNDCTPDKSIDKLFSVLDQFPERKEAVKIVNHERNRGLAAARNTAIAEATGEFVYHLDSDDYIEHNCLEDLVQNQIENLSDIVSSYMYINENTIDDKYKEPKYKDKNDMLLHILRSMNHHEIWGRLIRRSLYTVNELNSLEGNNHGEGFYALARLTYFANKISLVPEYLYHYIMNPNSYCHSFTSWEKEKRGLDEGLCNLLGIQYFFTGKEDSFFIEIRNNCLEQICYRLIHAVEMKDRLYFYKHKHLLRNYNYKEIRNVIGFKLALLLKGPFSFTTISLYLSFFRSIRETM